MQQRVRGNHGSGGTLGTLARQDHDTSRDGRWITHAELAAARAGGQTALLRVFGPLPLLWRQITAAPAMIRIRRVGRGVLAGLAGIAAVLVLLLGSFSRTMPDLAAVLHMMPAKETAASNSVISLLEPTVAIASFAAVSAEPPVTRMTDGERGVVPRDPPTESVSPTEPAVAVRQDDTASPGAAITGDNAAPPAQAANAPLIRPTVLPTQRSRSSRDDGQRELRHPHGRGRQLTVSVAALRRHGAHREKRHQ